MWGFDPLRPAAAASGLPPDALAGIARASARALALSISLAYRASMGRAQSRAPGAVLGGTVSLSGRARVGLVRARAAFPSGTTANVAGIARTGTQRALAVAGTKVALTGRVRTLVRAARGAIVTGKTSLAGRSRVGLARASALPFTVRVAMVGKACALGYAKALRIELAYRAAPMRSLARARGVVQQKVLLSGRARAELIRAKGAFVVIAVLRGTARGLVRARAVAGTKTALAGRARVLPRAIGLTRSKVNIVGRARVLTRSLAVLGIKRRITGQARIGLQRGRGALTFHATGFQLTASKSRTLPRVRTTSITLAVRSAPARVLARSKGALRKIWLKGTARVVVERGRGFVTGVGTGGDTETRGTARMLPARANLSHIITTFSVAESMAHARARGVLSLVGITFVSLAGRARTLLRTALGAVLPQLLQLRGTSRTAPIVVSGLPGFGLVQYLDGRARCTTMVGLASLQQAMALPTGGLSVNIVVGQSALLRQQGQIAASPCRVMVPIGIGRMETNRPALQGTLRVVTRMYAQAQTRVAIAGLLRSLGARAMGQTAKPPLPYIIDDQSGPQFMIEDLSGSLYVSTDSSGPRYLVEDIGNYD